VSEKCGYAAGIGARQTGKTELSEPRDLAGPALVTNFVVARQGRCTMCQKLTQIGNPDLDQRSKDAERTRNGDQQ
jgi:hypothetical protein